MREMQFGSSFKGITNKKNELLTRRAISEIYIGDFLLHYQQCMIPVVSCYSRALLEASRCT